MSRLDLGFPRLTLSNGDPARKCEKRPQRSLQSVLCAYLYRVRIICVFLSVLMPFKTDAAYAEGDGTQNAVLAKACDLAAASIYDKDRPSDVPGIPPNDRIHTDVAIPACEAAVHAMPQNARMLYQLARSYRAIKRFADASPLLQQAAQMGNALAANDLAVCYERGEGVEADPKAQFFYLDQAARAGLSMAVYNYGVLYLKSSSALPKDEKIARQLMQKAAEDNYPNAMYALGFMLWKGLGGNQDVVEARYWYEKAAQAGNFSAMNDFGFCLEYGRGGEKDLVEARKWFEKAANGNNRDAANNFGVMLMEGTGGPKDLDEARRQFRRAIALGEKKYASKNLEKLEAAK